MKKIIFAAAIVLPLLLSATLAAVNGGGEALENEEITEDSQTIITGYEAWDPIKIDDDDDFAAQAAAENWSGNGTPGSPYIIRGYEIYGGGMFFGEDYCIYIGNTTIHFELRDNLLYEARYGGISLHNVTNGVVNNNTAHTNMSYGIYLNHSENITLVNNNASSVFLHGIYLQDSKNNNIVNSTASNNNRGIYLQDSNNNIVTNNTLSSNGDGLSLLDSHNNTLTNNTISWNSVDGIRLSNSVGIRLSNNTMQDNRIDIRGTELEYWNTHSINGSNTVNGKPVYYLKNETGDTLPPDRGQIILANCTHFTVENQDAVILLGFSNNNNISNNSQSITLHFSNNNTVTNNSAPISLIDSDSNYVARNNASDGYRGIYLENSDFNIITNNTASKNEYGVYLFRSNHALITNNTLSNNDFGMWFYFSSYNTATNNTMENEGILIGGGKRSHWNTQHIDMSNTANGKPVYYLKNQTGGTVPSGMGQVILANCTDVTIENQNYSHVSSGIQIGFSDNNTVSNNTASYNGYTGIYLQYSNNNLIFGSTIYNNYYGLLFSTSNDNKLYHNNIIDNTYQAYDNGENMWDAGDPATGGKGGNYWSNYDGEDRGDGIGDIPYDKIISGDNQDNYPWMSPGGWETYDFVTPPSISITRPTGGESWEIGVVEEIMWDTSAGTGNITSVDIDYSTDDGVSWTSIVSDLDDTSSYNWTVPNEPTETARIRITVHDDKDRSDSDISGNFEIVEEYIEPPSVSLSRPTGGEMWYVGSEEEIVWTATAGDGDITTVDIDYSIDGGDSWASIFSGLDDTGSYDWTVPDEPTETARIRITVHDENDESNQDISGTFEIAEITTPPAPRNLEATPGDEQATLEWSPPDDDGGTEITEYRIYRGTTAGESYFHDSVGGDTLTYTDTGLTNNVTYYYRVSAVNAVGEGDRTEEVSVTPREEFFLPVDMILNVNPTSGEAPLELTIHVSARNEGNIIGTIPVTIDDGVVYLLEVPAGGSVEHEFTRTLEEPGEYEIEFGDETVTVEVYETEKTPDDDTGFLSNYWWIIPIIIVVVIAALFIFTKGMRKEPTVPDQPQEDKTYQPPSEEPEGELWEIEELDDEW